MHTVQVVQVLEPKIDRRRTKMLEEKRGEGKIFECKTKVHIDSVLWSGQAD